MCQIVDLGKSILNIPDHPASSCPSRNSPSPGGRGLGGGDLGDFWMGTSSVHRKEALKQAAWRADGTDLQLYRKAVNKLPTLEIPDMGSSSR